MIFKDVNHIPKSNMAYSLNGETLNILIQVGKNDIEKIEIIQGDPYSYEISNNGNYIWNGSKQKPIEMKFFYSTKYYDFYIASFIPSHKRCKYAFLLHSNKQIYFYNTNSIKPISKVDNLYNLFEYFNFPYINEEDIFKAPDWVKNTTWYQIFPERFAKSSNKKGKYLEWGSITDNIKNNMFFGGDILGIIEKIDYLTALGITGIYFTPIFKSPSAHKYDTEDYYQIDSQFGSNSDFKKLVNICHQNNIRIMIDLVFNHCGWNFFMWQDVLKHKENSIYHSNFFINGDPINFELDQNNLPLKMDYYDTLNFETFAFTPFMPKFNSASRSLRKYLFEVAKYWLINYDIDGFRLDVSNEVSHYFWREFRREVKSIKSDVYILGENWDDSTAWLLGDQMDSVMNYQLSYPIWNFFCKSSISTEEFIYRINKIFIQYPQNVLPYLFNLLDSHDTERLLYRCNNNIRILKLCYIFIFSFPGAPTIFYGDEVGLTGGNDPQCRQCMIWDTKKQNQSLLEFFKWLIQARQRNDDFKSSDFKWLYGKNRIIAYQKNNTIFILNLSKKEVVLDMLHDSLYVNYTNLQTLEKFILTKNTTINKEDFLILKI